MAEANQPLCQKQMGGQNDEHKGYSPVNIYLARTKPLSFSLSTSKAIECFVYPVLEITHSTSLTSPKKR